MTVGTYPTLASLSKESRDFLESGMLRPAYQQLTPPLRLFRFVDKKKGPRNSMVSPWWIDEEDFHKILSMREHSRSVHGVGLSSLSLGFVARWANAVPQEWQKDGTHSPTSMDMLVQGDLRSPIDAFVGRGKTKRETSPNGIDVAWSGWKSITQIYIPAFFDADFATVEAAIAPGPPSYFKSTPLYVR